jgi:hypothetical protein
MRTSAAVTASPLTQGFFSCRSENFDAFTTSWLRRSLYIGIILAAQSLRGVLFSKRGMRFCTLKRPTRCAQAERVNVASLAIILPSLRYSAPIGGF